MAGARLANAKNRFRRNVRGSWTGTVIAATDISPGSVICIEWAAPTMSGFVLKPKGRIEAVL